MMKLFVLCCLSLCVFVDFRVRAECSGCLLTGDICVEEGKSRYDLPNPVLSSTGYCIKRTCIEGKMKLDHEEEGEPGPRDCSSSRPCRNCHCHGLRYTCSAPKGVN